jgi:hypothetical protein
VELAGRRVDDVLPGRQARLLFAYLVMMRHQRVTRDALVEALWAGDPPPRVGAALSVLISKVRAVVGAEVLRGRSELSLVLPEPAHIDVETALAALHAAESANAVRDWRRAWSPALTAHFVARRPFLSEAFWIRRMAQETAIHRIDAELGTGQPVAAIPDDLAVDGIDELLAFVVYGATEWADYFADVVAGSPGRTYAIRADGTAWRVRTGPGLFAVEDGNRPGPADATVSGPPAAVLRWVWNRESGPSDVTVEGTHEAVDELKRCIATATQ